MKILLLLLGLAALAYVLFWSVHFYQKYQIGHGLVKKAVPYQLLSVDHSKSLLVLGDSTGVGVGAATSSETVAALFAAQMRATYVENLAVSGAEQDHFGFQREWAGQIARLKVG